MQTQAIAFLTALFDVSFSSFITARVIRVLYVVGLILAGLTAFMMLGIGFGQGVVTGILMLIIAPLVFLLSAMYLRVTLEVLIVIFRISDNVARIAESSAPPGI
jgi:hypothetical protein